jgi:hypothetical protein
MLEVWAMLTQDRIQREIYEAREKARRDVAAVGWWPRWGGGRVPVGREDLAHPTLADHKPETIRQIRLTAQAKEPLIWLETGA